METLLLRKYYHDFKFLTLIFGVWASTVTQILGVIMCPPSVSVNCECIIYVIIYCIPHKSICDFLTHDFFSVFKPFKFDVYWWTTPY